MIEIVKFFLDKCGQSTYKRNDFTETDLKLINILSGQISLIQFKGIDHQHKGIVHQRTIL